MKMTSSTSAPEKNSSAEDPGLQAAEQHDPGATISSPAYYRVDWPGGLLFRKTCDEFFQSAHDEIRTLATTGVRAAASALPAQPQKLHKAAENEIIHAALTLDGRCLQELCSAGAPGSSTDIVSGSKVQNHVETTAGRGFLPADFRLVQTDARPQPKAKFGDWTRTKFVNFKNRCSRMLTFGETKDNNIEDPVNQKNSSASLEVPDETSSTSTKGTTSSTGENKMDDNSATSVAIAPAAAVLAAGTSFASTSSSSRSSQPEYTTTSQNYIDSNASCLEVTTLSGDATSSTTGKNVALRVNNNSQRRYHYPPCLALAFFKGFIQTGCLLFCATYLQLRKAGFGIRNLHFQNELRRNCGDWFKPVFASISFTQCLICPMEHWNNGEKSALHDFVAVSAFVSALLHSRIFVIPAAVEASPLVAALGVPSSLLPFIPAFGLGGLSAFRKFCELKIDAYGEAEREIEAFCAVVREQRGWMWEKLAGQIGRS
ncbi:unnamed protein product [Amoebophrya sp. A120]|nr:unnamed protein product [Amoebophrya sp. A120]|eukprot:GSA120T00007103001.1